MGIPLGMLAGIYLAEYGANSFLATPTRFIADVLTGRAEHRGGHPRV